MKKTTKIILAAVAGLMLFTTAGSLYVKNVYIEPMLQQAEEMKQVTETFKEARSAEYEKEVEKVIKEVVDDKGIKLQTISQKVEVINPNDWTIGEKGGVEKVFTNADKEKIKVITIKSGHTFFAIVDTPFGVPIKECEGIRYLVINNTPTPTMLKTDGKQCFIYPTDEAARLLTDGLYAGYEVTFLGLTVKGNETYNKLLDSITLFAGE